MNRQFVYRSGRCLAVALCSLASSIGQAEPWGEPPGSRPTTPDHFFDYSEARPVEGIVLAREQIQLISLNWTKDQLRQVLGTPHFNEGILDVTEWSYLITPLGRTPPVTCQLKLVFFKEKFNDPYRVSRLSWDKPDCLTDDVPAAVSPTATSYDAEPTVGLSALPEDNLPDDDGAIDASRAPLNILPGEASSRNSESTTEPQLSVTLD